MRIQSSSARLGENWAKTRFTSQLVKVVMALPSARTSTGKISAGYTHEMMPKGVEEAEDKIHGYHGAQLVGVLRVEDTALGPH